MENKTAIDTLLDEAKEKSGISSDYALALTIGVKRQTISRYRKNLCTPDDYAKSRLADLTGRSLQEVIARIELENEPNEEKRKYWQDFYRRLGGVAASIAVSVTLIVTPHPTEAAPILKVSDMTMYIMLSARVKRWIKKAALAVRTFQISFAPHSFSG